MITSLAGPAIRTIVAALAVTTLTGCASTPAPGTPARVLATGSAGARAGVLEMNVRNDGQAQPFAAPPADVYTALESSYAALRIPLTKVDGAGRSLGNDGLKMRRQLGTIEMRKAFDCGGTAGMPNAETYEILASIVSSVQEDGANSVLTTVAEASAQNPSYPGSGVRCSSAGAIESAIVRHVRARLNSR
jgi:hypothetical protein